MSDLPDLPCKHTRLTFGCGVCRDYARGALIHVTGSKAVVAADEASYDELTRRVDTLVRAAEAVWAVAAVPRVVDQWRNLDRMCAALVERCHRLQARVAARGDGARV